MPTRTVSNANDLSYNACPACKKPVPLLYRIVGPRFGPFKCPNCGTHIQESIRSAWRFLMPVLALVALVLVAALILKLLFLAILGIFVLLGLQLVWRIAYAKYERRAG